MSLQRILMKIKDEDVKLVRFELTDIHGVAKSKTIPVCLFEKKTNDGLAFILREVFGAEMGDVSGEAAGVYGEEGGYPDALTFPDLDTFLVLPWLEGTARVLIEPTIQGSPHPAHPRVLARKQLARLDVLGMSLLAAHGHEFRVFDKDTLRPFVDDDIGFVTIRNAPITGLMNQIIQCLLDVGIQVETMHSEACAGMVEITYKPAFGIRSADNAHTYKTAIKEMALLNGYVASFITSPLSCKVVSSCHFNHSLWDAKSEAPLLYEMNGSHGLSEVGQQWLAGLLAHAPATKVLMAPTVNCLDIEPSPMVPTNATWGVDNRTCLVRLKDHGTKNTYFEHRMGTSACNPYICIAAVVAAGLDGIDRKMELPLPVSGSAFRKENVPPETAELPTNLEDALQALLDDSIICEALGEEFIKCFTTVKRHEAKMAREAKANKDGDLELKNFSPYK